MCKWDKALGTCYLLPCRRAFAREEATWPVSSNPYRSKHNKGPPACQSDCYQPLSLKPLQNTCKESTHMSASRLSSQFISNPRSTWLLLRRRQMYICCTSAVYYMLCMEPHVSLYGPIQTGTQIRVEHLVKVFSGIGSSELRTSSLQIGKASL